MKQEGRFPEGHLGCGLVLLLGENVALFDFHGLAQLVGLLARFRKRQELRASDPDVPSLAVQLDSKQPRSGSALPNFQEKTVTVLIGAGILQCGLDRNHRELAHFLPHIPAIRSGKHKCGEATFSPHTFPTLGIG